ncbi:hypothetical protein ACHAXS_005517 [Conticribra weissflogii]
MKESDQDPELERGGPMAEAAAEGAEGSRPREEEEEVIIRGEIPMMDVAAAAAAAAANRAADENALERPHQNDQNHRQLNDNDNDGEVHIPGATSELHGLVYLLSQVDFSPFDDESFRKAVAAREAKGDQGKSQLIFPNVDSCMLPLLMSMAYLHLASHAISDTMFRDHDEDTRGCDDDDEEEEEEEEEQEEAKVEEVEVVKENNNNNGNDNDNDNNNPTIQLDLQIERIIGRYKRNPSYLFRKSLHYWPKNPAALSLLANYHRMKLTSSTKEICRLYVEACEQARWWRKVALEFLEDDVDYWRPDHGDGDGDDRGDGLRVDGAVSETMTEKIRIKEWVELIVLNGALGVDYVGDDRDDAHHNEDDHHRDDGRNPLRDHGDGYSFSEVEATSAFMAAMLLSTLGEHQEALTHLERFPVSHRIHPNVWKAARSHDHHGDGDGMDADDKEKGNGGGSNGILFPPRIYHSDHGILPPHIYRRLCRLFAPDAPYWEESGYHHRGYYSYFIDLETEKEIRTSDGTATRKSVKERPTNLIEDVIVTYLLPLAERTLREEHVTKASGDELGSGDDDVPGDDNGGTASDGERERIATIPRIIGAEWWTHTRPLGANLGHQLHFDTDESLLGNSGKVTHPVISSVLYLTGGGAGNRDDEANDATGTAKETVKGAGSTIVFDQTPSSEEVASKAWIGHARDNAFLNFPGNLLHGVLPCEGGREDDDDDDDKRGSHGDAKEINKKKPGNRDDKNDTGPHRLTFMVGFWTRNVPEGMGEDRKLYGPCGPLPPATEEHSWVVDCGEGYPIKASDDIGDSAKDLWLKNVSHEGLPSASPAWEVINRNQDDHIKGDAVASSSSLLVIPKGLDHRYFVHDAPDCFTESLFDKDDTF